MNILGIGSVIDSVGKVADDLITTEKERIQLGLEGRKIDQAVDLAQIGVNNTEAASASLFVAGWRPALGWCGAVAMGYQFVLYPLLTWAWALAQANGHLPAGMQPPPMLDTDALWVILSGILGLSGMRSFEKSKGVTR